MHELDALLKPLILKFVFGVIVAAAGLLAIPIGLLLSRRLFRNKSRRTLIVGSLLLTGLLFCITAAAVTGAGLVILAFTVIDADAKPNCVSRLQKTIRFGSEWAASHDGRLPADFTFLSADRSYYELSVCGRQSGESDREAAQKNYDLVSPNARADNPSVLFLRCRNHGHAVHLDGTVVVEAKKP